MATIHLSQGKVTVVDDEDLERCLAYTWHACYGARRAGIWYARTNIRRPDGRKTTMKLHRLLMGYPVGFGIDHIDGDGLNNRRLNLRVATQAQNLANQYRKQIGTSAFKGVCWDKAHRKWRAGIRVNYKSIYLGLFSDEREAAMAYDCASVLHFGAFANPNFGCIGPRNPFVVGVT